MIDDAFALAEANQLPYEVHALKVTRQDQIFKSPSKFNKNNVLKVALNVTAYLSNETELLPWLSALRGLRHAMNLFGDEPDSEGLRVSGYFYFFWNIMQK